MSLSPSRTLYGFIGGVIMLAVLVAGCTSQYGLSPTPVPTTPLPTPATTRVTTVATPATPVPTTTATTAVTTVVQTPAPPVKAAVTIQNFAFDPVSVTVPVGSTVTWTNKDAAAHQIASDAMVFMGNPMSQDTTYSFTFMHPGTYAYHCAIHPSMKGTVIVT